MAYTSSFDDEFLQYAIKYRECTKIRDEERCSSCKMLQLLRLFIVIVLPVL